MAAQRSDNALPVIRPRSIAAAMASTGSPGKQLLPRNKLPNQHDILDHLAALHAATTGKTPIPDELPLLPAPLPKIMMDTEFTDMAAVGLQEDDFDKNKPVRNQPLQRILLALQIKHYRAIGVQPPTQYRVHTLLTKMNDVNPELPRGKLLTISPAMDPIRVIRPGPANFLIITDKAANTGIPIVPNKSHKNDCRCMALYANNNYETLQPIRACLPQFLQRRYPEDDDKPTAYEIGFSSPVHKNFSDIYASEVSCSGTVLMKMVRRCPVAQITRSKPVYKEPQFHDIDISNSRNLAGAIEANMDRNEIHQYTKYLSKPPMPCEDINITRFLPIKKLMSNIDVRSYGANITSMEDILINEPLVEPFYGRQSCCFCDSKIFLSDATSLLAHFIDEHMALTDAYLSCPACLLPTVIHASMYATHYRTAHARTIAFIFVLNEISVHSRNQHAHVLNLFLFMAREMKQVTTAPIDTKYVSPLGGFSMENPADLEEEISSLQQDLLPTKTRTKDRSQSINPYHRVERTQREMSPDWETVYTSSSRTSRGRSKADKDAFRRHSSDREEHMNKHNFEKKPNKQTRRLKWTEEGSQSEDDERKYIGTRTVPPRRRWEDDVSHSDDDIRQNRSRPAATKKPAEAHTDETPLPQRPQKEQRKAEEDNRPIVTIGSEEKSPPLN
jgi:hypothetical protein